MGSGAELNPKVLWKHCLIQLFNYLTLFTQLTLFLVWFFPGRSPIFATGTLRLIRGKEKMPERALPGWELLAGWSNSNSNFVSNWIEVQCRTSALHNVLDIKREREGSERMGGRGWVAKHSHKLQAADQTQANWTAAGKKLSWFSQDLATNSQLLKKVTISHLEGNKARKVS